MRPRGGRSRRRSSRVCHCSSAGVSAARVSGVRAVDQLPHERLQARPAARPDRRPSESRPPRRGPRARSEIAGASGLPLQSSSAAARTAGITFSSTSGECAQQERRSPQSARSNRFFVPSTQSGGGLRPAAIAPARRAEELRAVPRRVGERVVVDLLRVAEQLDEPREVARRTRARRRRATRGSRRSCLPELVRLGEAILIVAPSPVLYSKLRGCACPPSGSGGARRGLL